MRLRRSALLQTCSILIAFVVLLVATKPLEYTFQILSLNDFRSNYVAEIITRLLIVILAIFFISRSSFKRFNGLDEPWRIGNPQSLIVVVTLFSAFLYGNWSNYSDAGTLDVMLYLSYAILVGLAEELVFRGILLPIWIRKTGNVIWGIAISSFMFGSIHFINLSHQPGNFDGITSQVLVATSLGFFFAGLLFRTRNVIVVGLIHGFFNIALSSGQFASEVRNLESVAEENSTSDLASIIFSFSILLLLVLSGVLMSKWEGKDNILARVRND